MTPEEFQVLDKSLDTARDYADTLVMAPLEQLGGLLADTVGYWRLKNRVRLFVKTKQFMEEQGVKPTTKLLPSVFVPLVEEAGNTDDETLGDMFARLLAAHLDPAKQDGVHPTFAKVLGQFSPLDARVLQLIDEKEEWEWKGLMEGRIKDRFYWQVMDVMVEIKKQGDIPGGQIRLSVENLVRLGLIAIPELGNEHQHGVNATRFGQRLLSACGPKTYWRNQLGDHDEHNYRQVMKQIERDEAAAKEARRHREKNT